MRNHWIRVGDVVRIELRRRKGQESVWAVISLKDFAKVHSYPGRWVVKWNKTAQTFYARNNANFGWKCGYMHRLILGVDDRHVWIDHKDHNGLNNTRGNLRKSNVKLNGFNRRGAMRRSTSSARNCYWNAREQQYMVWFVHNGKRHYFGYYKTLEEADRVAKAERARFA